LEKGRGKGFFAVARLGICFYANSEKTQKTLRDQKMVGSDFMRKVFRLFSLPQKSFSPSLRPAVGWAVRPTHAVPSAGRHALCR
jgi:hypothetical protein